MALAPASTTDGDRPRDLTGDPYVDWTLATGLRHLRPGAWVPLLVEIDPAVVKRAAFAALEWLGTAARGWVQVPEIFRLPPAGLDGGEMLAFSGVLVDRAHLGDVLGDPGWRATVIDFALGAPLDLPKAPPARDADAAATDASLPSADALKSLPARVAIAVLDEGIAVAHERFRTGAASRIRRYWNQDGGNGASPGAGLPGTEFSAVDLDRAVGNASAAGWVDEERVYVHELGIVDPARDGFKALLQRRSHGTAVLSLAAAVDGDAAKRPLFVVELPEAAVSDPVAAPLYVYIALGMLWVVARAQAERRRGELLPVVLNLSYGPHQGPHDGSKLFERFVDALVRHTQRTWTPLSVVLAAGNFRQHRVHATLTVAPGASQGLPWRVQPEDVSPSFLELWLPATSGATVTVEVTAPSGERASVSASQRSDQVSGPHGEMFRVRYRAPRGARTRPQVVVLLQPTAVDPSFETDVPLAPAGLWTVRVRNDGDVPARVDGWIWRDGHGTRRPPGRQSYFDDPAYVRFAPDGRPMLFDPAPDAGTVSRRGTLSGIATGTETIVIGGYRRDNDEPALYSSMGPVAGTGPARPSPTGLVPSEDTGALHGVLAAGTRSGSVVPMNGTSVAAPQAARLLADALAAGRALGPWRPPANVPAQDVVAVAGQGLLDAPPLLPRTPIRRREQD